MNVGHIFSGVLNFFEKGIHAVKDGTALTKVEDVAKEIDKVLPMAITVVKLVDSQVPNRTVEEFIALAEKYQLHVTTAIVNDPIQSKQLLEAAALKEIQHLVSSANNSTLNAAINLAVAYQKAAGV